MEHFRKENYAYFRAMWFAFLRVPPRENVPEDFPEDTKHFLLELGVPSRTELFPEKFYQFEYQFQNVSFSNEEYFIIGFLPSPSGVHSYIALRIPSGQVFYIFTDIEEPSRIHNTQFVNSSIIQYFICLVTYESYRPGIIRLKEQTQGRRGLVFSNNTDEMFAVEDAIETELEALIDDFKRRIQKIDRRVFEDTHDHWSETLLSWLI